MRDHASLGFVWCYQEANRRLSMMNTLRHKGPPDIAVCMKKFHPSPTHIRTVPSGIELSFISIMLRIPYEYQRLSNDSQSAFGSFSLYTEDGEFGDILEEEVEPARIHVTELKTLHHFRPGKFGSMTWCSFCDNLIWPMSSDACTLICEREEEMGVCLLDSACCPSDQDIHYSVSAYVCTYCAKVVHGKCKMDALFANECPKRAEADGSDQKVRLPNLHETRFCVSSRFTGSFTLVSVFLGKIGTPYIANPQADLFFIAAVLSCAIICLSDKS